MRTCVHEDSDCWEHGEYEERIVGGVQSDHKVGGRCALEEK